ncbi:unnamed protein product, partial [Cylindrotheca closterium]
RQNKKVSLLLPTCHSANHPTENGVAHIKKKLFKYKVFDTYDPTLIVMSGFDASMPDTSLSDNLHPHKKGMTLYK